MNRARPENELIRQLAAQKGISVQTVKNHLNEGMTLAEALMKKDRRRIIVKKIQEPVKQEKKEMTLREFVENRRRKVRGKVVWVRAGVSGGYYTYAGDKDDC